MCKFKVFIIFVHCNLSCKIDLTWINIVTESKYLKSEMLGNVKIIFRIKIICTSIELGIAYFNHQNMAPLPQFIVK